MVSSCILNLDNSVIIVLRKRVVWPQL